MGPKGAETSGFGAVGFTKNAQPLEEESTAGYVVKILRMWFLLRSYDGNLNAVWKWAHEKRYTQSLSIGR